MAKYVTVSEDFLGAGIDTTAKTIIGDYHWRYGGTTIVDPSSVVGEANSPGIISLIAGSTSGFIAWMSLGNAATSQPFFVSDVESFKFRLRPSAITTMRLTFGLGQSVSSANFGTDGVFFRYDTSISQPVRAVTRASSTETAVSTSLSPGTSDFLSWEMVRASASLYHAFAIDTSGNRQFAASCTANIPSAVALSLGVQIETLTAGARSVTIDLIELNSKALTLR